MDVESSGRGQGILCPGQRFSVRHFIRQEGALVATEVQAPMVGKIIEVLVEPGGRVEAKDDPATIESMKMEIPVG